MLRDPFGRPLPTPPKVDDRLNLGKESSPTGSLMIWINGEPYSLIVMPLGINSEARLQLRLTGMKGSSYQLTVDLDGHLICDCPAWAFSKEVPGPKTCKHCAACRGSGLSNLVWKKP